MAGRRRDSGRASGPKPSGYITPEGFARIQAEYENLWGVERPKVTEAVSIAAALGDRSENADYIYGKKRLREIDSRLHYLRKRMDDLTVVRDLPERHDKVFFGAWVTLADEQGESVRYRIVGSDEADPGSRAISMDSPLGRALMGRELDDEVKVVRPKGVTHYTVEEISYRAPD
jgi:transcription elongation factor GreB